MQTFIIHHGDKQGPHPKALISLTGEGFIQEAYEPVDIHQASAPRRRQLCSPLLHYTQQRLAGKKTLCRQMTGEELVPAFNDFCLWPAYTLLRVHVQHHMVVVGDHGTGTKIQCEDITVHKQLLLNRFPTVLRALTGMDILSTYA